MTTVNVVIVPFDIADPAAPKGAPGQLPGLYKFWIEDSAGSVIAEKTDTVLTAAFENFGPGSFVAKATLLDSTGGVFESVTPVQAAFVIAAESVSLPAPKEITVTLA